MRKAVRVGCVAAGGAVIDRGSEGRPHPGVCGYPDCNCEQIPNAVIAAVSFALLDAVDALRGFMPKVD
jgi:hypothetical protein